MEATESNLLKCKIKDTGATSLTFLTFLISCLYYWSWTYLTYSTVHISSLTESIVSSAYVFDVLTSIEKAIDILQAITWVAAAWREETEKTNKTCFRKWDITEQTVEKDDDKLGGWFDALLIKLAVHSGSDITDIPILMLKHATLHWCPSPIQWIRR